MGTKLPHEELFDIIDTDGNGELSRNEMQHGMRKLGITLTPVELDAVLRAFDSDGNGTIQFEEFFDLLNDYALNEMAPPEEDTSDAKMFGYKVQQRVKGLVKPSKREMPQFGARLDDKEEQGTVLGPGKIKGTVMVRFDSGTTLNLKPSQIRAATQQVKRRSSTTLLRASTMG